MQLIDGKKTIALFLMLALGLACTTCKKISKYPVNMFGLWVADNSDCSWITLDINKNGKGNYGPADVCGKGIHARGRVSFTKAAIYVGLAKLKFKSEPEDAAANDSIFTNYTHRKTKIFARMTIEESNFRGGKTYTMYKITEN